MSGYCEIRQRGGMIVVEQFDEDGGLVAEWPFYYQEAAWAWARTILMRHPVDGPGAAARAA
jgi:hypothetical protein